nr:hypothetical protein [Saprospiraceae bacterium]
MKVYLIFIAYFLTISLSIGQSDYPTLDEIRDQLETLRADHSDYFDFSSIATSPGGNEVWLAKMGSGDEDLTPGLMFVSGVDGRHPAGTQMTLHLAKKLLAEKDEFLNRFYFYFVPVLSPDAYEQYHGDLIYERLGNAKETDIDRDGRISEDSYDDLDGNGLISQIRITDPTGKYTAHSSDDRVLFSIEKRPVEEVIYRVISEGIDNDKDGLFNEDGPGGVNLNNNFSFNYPAFQPGAGEHAVSEEGNRNLAEFLFERWNIYAVFTFGLENNLSHPVSFDRAKVSQRVITGPLEKDAKVASQIGKLYEDKVGWEDAVKLEQGPGSFSSWAYFHYCRYSFVSPAWWAPVTIEKEEEVEGDDNSVEESENGVEEEGDRSKITAKDLRENYDLRYIHWAESEGITDYFIPWTSIEHPDFPGREAEVGGFKPFVRNNPPLTYLEEVADGYLDFIKSFGKKMPVLEFGDVKVEEIDHRVFRVSGRVINSGQLPTGTELGDRSRWVRDIRHRVLLNSDQELLTGHYRDFHKSLQPGEYFEFSWLISGRGEVTLDAASPMTGVATEVIELR